jgi:hypothetical protein
MANTLLMQLTSHGVVRLPSLLTAAQLRSIQDAFAARLQRLSWNDVMGYERTERYRHMIQDVLILDQGILDLALHPLVQEILRAYLGPEYQLVEAKGWLSLPTTRDFHGWHGDAWYDQTIVKEIPKEIKLAIYLTDVRSGAFSYIKGSHQKQHPRLLSTRDMPNISREAMEDVTGPAGSAFLFDTSGIHRQSMPVLEPRHAIFLNYHDPAVPLQAEDVTYYRYHPLILNAAFLGNLSEEDRRVLGFGDKRNYRHGFVREVRHPVLESVNRSLVELNLRINSALYYPRRALAKMQAALGRG